MGEDNTVLLVHGRVDELTAPEALTDMGFDVLTAVTADDAMRTLAGGSVDCVASATSLPDRTGLQLLANVDEQYPAIRDVLFAANDPETIAARVSDSVTGAVDDAGQAVAACIESRADASAETNTLPEGVDYRHLVEQDIAGIYVVDGRELSYVNPKMAEMFGYEQSDLVGRDPRELVADEYEESVEEARRRILDGETEDQHHTYVGVTRDGDRFDAEAHGTAVGDETFVGLVVDVTDRREQERKFSAVFEGVSDAVVVTDDDGEFVEANSAACDLFGLPREELFEHRIAEFVADEYDVEAEWEAFLRGETERGTVPVVRPDGETRVAEYHASTDVLPGRHVGVLRDVTERRLRETQTAGLNDLLREYLQIDERQELCNVTVGVADERLNLPVAAVALFDEERGALRPVARTPTAQRRLDGDDLFDRDDVWSAFAGGEATTVEWPGPTDDDASRLAVHPLGRHGVLVAGLGDGSETGVDTALVETVAGNLRGALDRVEREEQLRDREERLAEQNEWLDRLNRINDVIRRIDRALVAAASRDEIQRTVCSELASADEFTFAWFGRYDSATDRVTPVESGGDGEGYLEGVTDDDGTVGAGPAVTAARTREPQVTGVHDATPPFEPWEEAALRRQFRSSMSIPLVYRDRLYGVLTVFGAASGLFDEVERQVLGELGDNVAHALNAFESKRALLDDTVVELELSVELQDIPLLEPVAGQSPAEFELDHVVPATDGAYTVYITVHGLPADEVLALADAAPSISDCSFISEESDGNAFEATLTGESPVTWLLDHSAVPRVLSASEAGGRVVVDLPRETAVRDFVETFQNRFAGGELLARRERERSVQSNQQLQADLADRLTPRQQEVLRTAFVSGYFESPRDRTGSEVASSLGISQPTFNNHLRAALRKSLEPLLDDDGLDT